MKFPVESRVDKSTETRELRCSDGRFRNFYTRFDAIRFFEKISISNYERFLPSTSRLVHLAQSVAAATINVANLV